MTLKGMAGGGRTTPNTHDGLFQKWGGSEANYYPACNMEFPLMGQEESLTLIGYSGRGTHATWRGLKLECHALATCTQGVAVLTI